MKFFPRPQNPLIIAFKIPFLKWGGCLGYAEIIWKKEPYINLFLTIDEADFSELGILFNLEDIKKAAPFLQDCQKGLIKGRINVSGPMRSPQVIGRLEMNYSDHKGLKKKVVFSFRGIYPTVKIEDSFLKEGEELVYSMRGDIRLDELFAGKDISEDLEYFMRPRDKRSFVLMTEKAASSKIRILNEDKNLNSNLALSDWHLGADAVSWKGSGDAVELEHGITEKQAFKMYMGQDEEMIGVEQKVRF